MEAAQRPLLELSQAVRQNEAIHLQTKSMALRYHMDIDLTREKHV